MDNSYKWAGGGFVSNAADLVLFGNALLSAYSFLSTKCERSLLEDHGYPSSSEVSKQASADIDFILKPATVRMMWKPVVKMNEKSDVNYAMGWMTEDGNKGVAGGRGKPLIVAHTGGSIGATSILAIAPEEASIQGCSQPHGVVVAVLFNLQQVSGIYHLGKKMATEVHRAAYESK